MFVIFRVDKSSLVHIDNTKKISVSSVKVTQGVDDTTITAEAEYFINFLISNRKIDYV